MAERPIARHFSGRVESLESSCSKLGGAPFETDAGYELSYELPALPKVPIFLMYNDKDEEFGAECRLLFRRNAEAYLDMESLAIIGLVLQERLCKNGI